MAIRRRIGTALAGLAIATGITGTAVLVATTPAMAMELNPDADIDTSQIEDCRTGTKCYKCLHASTWTRVTKYHKLTQKGCYDFG
ncbi:hypothetical protein [Actinoplanes sp. HUAS TT8]|uniref:hypothetical protein n=1 Tax=Actinoplanes sp. HUAS TT8 TaxID=3447453 RepID=UPI003F528F53